MLLNRMKAYFDLYELDLETIDDQLSKAVAVYETPFSSDAALDDMGMNARSVRFRCYWLNERYHLHKLFLNSVQRQDELHTLRHPAYGRLKGMVRNTSIHHDDRQQCAEIDIEFVVESAPLATLSSLLAVLSAVQSTYRAGIATIMDAVERATAIVLSAAEAAQIATSTLTSGSSALSQLSGLSRAGRLLVATLDNAVGTVAGLVSAGSNPTSSFLNTIDFGSTFPGRIVQACAQCVERQATAIRAVVQTPSEFAGNYAAGVAELRSQAPELSAYLAATGAFQGAMSLAEMYETDESNRRTLVAAEASPAFDAAGNLIQSAAPPTVVPLDDLERSLAIMREAIQSAIDLDRENLQLATAAQLLLRHVNEIKVERERLVDVTITSRMPMHAVCLRYGLDYRAAARILALNPTVENPSFVEGALTIYA